MKKNISNNNNDDDDDNNDKKIIDDVVEDSKDELIQQQKRMKRNSSSDNNKNNNDEDPVTNGENDDNNKQNVDKEDDGKKSKRRRKRSRKNKNNNTNTDQQGSDDDNNNGVDTNNNNNNNNNNISMILNSNINKKKEDEVDRTVYIEGIPFTASIDDVKNFFHGHVISDLRLPVWHDSGRLRGYGHVVFTSIDIANQIIQQYNGKYIQNRYITLQKAQKPKSTVATDNNDDNNDTNSEPSKTIILNNLSYDATEDDIENVIMKQYSGASDDDNNGKAIIHIAPGGIRIVRHSDTQRSKGFAYVQLESIQDAIHIMNQVKNEKKPIMIHNRICRIDYDHGRVKGSFRTADRKLWTSQYGKVNNINKKYNNNNEDDNKNKQKRSSTLIPDSCSNNNNNNNNNKRMKR